MIRAVNAGKCPADIIEEQLRISSEWTVIMQPSSEGVKAIMAQQLVKAQLGELIREEA